MIQQRFNPGTTILILIVALVTILRLLTQYAEHSSSILSLTPLGALALFGGTYFKGRIKPFIIPLLVLFISDIILCFTVYSKFREGLLYPGWFWVYLSFVLIAIIGKLLIKKASVTNIVMTIVAATLIHWLVGNLSGCLGSTASEDFLAIYSAKLVSGINYELKFLLGTVVYAALMFTSFALIQSRYKKIKLTTSAS
jgi:hypothetical protein